MDTCENYIIYMEGDTELKRELFAVPALDEREALHVINSVSTGAESCGILEVLEEEFGYTDCEVKAVYRITVEENHGNLSKPQMVEVTPRLMHGHGKLMLVEKEAI